MKSNAKSIKRFDIKDNTSGSYHVFAEEKSTVATPLHWHSHFEIEMITEGEAISSINGISHEVKRGDVYLLTPADFHEFCPRGRVRLWHVAFDESMISDERLDELTYRVGGSCFSIDERTLGLLARTAELISEESRREDGGCSRELCECFLTLLLRDRDLGTLYRDERLGAIQKSITYMETHFRESPSLGDMARLSGFTPSYFSELFRRVTGQSFTERLAVLKTRHAKTLLSQGFSVTEACFRSGFGSTNNFLYTFKKLEGVPPSEYKKRLSHQP